MVKKGTHEESRKVMKKLVKRIKKDKGSFMVTGDQRLVYIPEKKSKNIGEYGGRSQFERPGSNSALRKATKWNPRNLPCPTCKKPNKLTPADKAHGYQCDECADRAESMY